MIRLNPGTKSRIFKKSSVDVIPHNWGFDEHRAAETLRPES